MSTSFLGQGLRHPFEFERRTGAPSISTATSIDEAHIQESIHQILGTAEGERFMRPDFGSRLHRLVFEGNDHVLRGLARHAVNDAIARWEKRVRILAIEFDEAREDAGRHMLPVRITYRLIASQREGNMVYPFYMERSR